MIACNEDVFGPSGKSFLSVLCIKLISWTANQTFYFNVFCDGTGSLTGETNSNITALKIDLVGGTEVFTWEMSAPKFVWNLEIKNFALNTGGFNIHADR